MESLATQKLQQLFSRTSKLYLVSSLFNFDDRSRAVFEAYSMRVHIALLTHLPLAQREPYYFRVKFTRLDELRRSPQEAHSIFIKVIRTPKSLTGPRDTEVVLMGLFTSYNASMVKGKVIENYRGGSYFPLFICNADSDEMLSVVQNSLDNMFQCTFVPFSWNWHRMTYVIGAWVVSNGIERGDNLKVNCTTTSPGCVLECDLHYKYDLNASYNRWKEFQTKMEATQIAQDRDRYIEKFWNEIDAKLRKYESISLNDMGLSKIFFPNLVVSYPGEVKAVIEDLSAGQKLLMDLTRVSQDFAGKGGEDFGPLRMIR